MAFVLVHSPLAGPTTWSWVADELRRHGHDVVVPSLVDGATSGSWEACVDAVVAAAPRAPAMVVGHSGAGPLLPEIAHRLDSPPSALVFVDAPLPPPAGQSPLVPEQFLEGLTALAQEGLVPPWSEWFEPGTMQTLIPEPELRDLVVAELPRLPLSYFQARVPVPKGWASATCAYILLSDAYRHEADEAAIRGWRVIELLGSHLDLVNEPVKGCGSSAPPDVARWPAAKVMATSADVL
jgi:pimeloyl-ACP methyl ester carboxylesterase